MGISTIIQRHAMANNKYMSECNPEKTNSYIMYLDANNLYKWAMSQDPPVGDFKWITLRELVEMMCNHSKITSGRLEVDMEYPKGLHDLHGEYPLAPENVTVNSVPKLILNFNNKAHYVLHYKYLRQYLDSGLKLTKIHQGIKYRESNFLGEYISWNTKSRQEASNDFEKTFTTR